MSGISFSVIVPVYNVEKHLPQCIDSIVMQKECQVEVILVDDGSTDNSGKICDDYADKYDCVYVIHKENGGLSDARNAGVNMATGEYLLFVDSDDYIAADSIAEIEKVILKYNCPDMVCLECVKVYPDEGKRVPMCDGITDEINTKSGEKLWTYIAGLPKYPASACSKTIKRALFVDNQLYFKKGILCEDLEWAVRVFLAADVIRYCEKDYYYYRQNRKGSISNTFTEKKLSDIVATMSVWCEKAAVEENLSKRKLICSLMEYVFRFSLMGVVQIDRKKRKIWKRCIRKMDWILGTRQDGPSRCIAFVYKIVGVELTGELLWWYLKARAKYIEKVQ